MAEIISISLNKEILDNMNFIQKKLEFSGRSEIVRAGIRNLINEYKELENLSGIVEGTIIVTHKESYTQEFSKIKHKFHDLVKTHIHHELKNHMCMEILLFNGKSQDIKDLYQKFVSSRKIDSIKIITS